MTFGVSVRGLVSYGTFSLSESDVLKDGVELTNNELPSALLRRFSDGKNDVAFLNTF
jgi:hypothetical protein